MATVSTIIDDTEARVDALQLQAEEHLAALIDLGTTEFSTDLPTSYNYAQPPQIQFPVFSATAPLIEVSGDPVPEAPAPVEFSTISDVLVPDLAAVSPTLDLPTLPSSTLPTAPGGAPEFVTPDIPGAPAVTLPAVPTFDSFALPDPPSIALPSFTAVLPTDDLVVPSNTFEYHEVAYQSALLDSLQAKLLSDMANGTYGIEANDEAAMLARFRDREGEIMLTRVQEAGRSMAARGFPLPPAILEVEIAVAQQEYQNKLSSASRDIYIKRADQFVEGRKFTIQQSQALEATLIGFYNSVQERALNVAKATLEATLAIYDALVKRYQARLEGYKAEATTFAERIRGELAKAEIYRTQVQAASLTVDMQKARVDVYRAQLEGINASVNIYRTQVEAANVRAQIERHRLDAFRAQVEAYQAQVGAKVAEFNMYTAGVQGQRARQDIYSAQVQAYSTQVTAAKTRSDVQVSRLTAEAEQARIQLANYQAQLEGFKAGVQRHIDAGRLNVDFYRANIDKFRAQTDGYQANAQLLQQGVLSVTQQNTEISRLQVENSKQRLAEAVEVLKNRYEITKYSAEKYYAQITATLAAISTLAVQTAEETE